MHCMSIIFSALILKIAWWIFKHSCKSHESESTDHYYILPLDFYSSTKRNSNVYSSSCNSCKMAIYLCSGTLKFWVPKETQQFYRLLNFCWDRSAGSCSSSSIGNSSESYGSNQSKTPTILYFTAPSSWKVSIWCKKAFGITRCTQMKYITPGVVFRFWKWVLKVIVSVR